MEYCNFIGAEQDENIEDSNEVEQNEETEYLDELVDVEGTEDNIDTEEEDNECDVNEANMDSKCLSDKHMTDLSYKIISFSMLKDTASHLLLWVVY